MAPRGAASYVSRVRLDLDTLCAAVAAEGRGIDLTGAVRRAGWESVVLETRDGWILRFPRPHVAFEREIAVLRRLDGRLPAPTPRVEWTGRRTQFAAYRKLDGFEFDLSAYERAAQAGPAEPGPDALARSLAGFLAAMHGALTPDEIMELGLPTPADPAAAVASLRDRLHRVPSGLRPALERLVAESERLWVGGLVPGPDVVLHNDFHFGNLVLDGPVGEVTGVWDFSCVQLGRPSSDLRYLANSSMDLLRRVADQYTHLTGQRVDVRAAAVANSLEAVTDALDLGEPEALVDAVAGWERAAAESAA